VTAAEIVGSLQRRGIALVPLTDGRLSYRPKNVLSRAEIDDIYRERDAIVRLLNADPVGWRVVVMATQVPAVGAIPLLLARPGIWSDAGTCVSCGDPLDSGGRLRCAPCVAAAIAALATAQGA
jgi:hypothetical protein